jgi:hypothetical protein
MMRVVGHKAVSCNDHIYVYGGEATPVVHTLDTAMLRQFFPSVACSPISATSTTAPTSPPLSPKANEVLAASAIPAELSKAQKMSTRLSHHSPRMLVH